jgi:pilus assembly protein CpaB
LEYARSEKKKRSTSPRWIAALRRNAKSPPSQLRFSQVSFSPMNRSALLIALVVAGLGVFLLVFYQRRFETEASGGERIKLLIAVKPIPRGTLVTDEMVATREIPQAYVEDRAIKEVEKPKILGLKVGNPVQAQQTLMWTDLVTSSEERKDLSSLVQPGSRAVAVRVQREDSNVALIRPGDYVDVIGVMSQTSTELRAGVGNPDPITAVVLLQRVLVLATGLDTSPEAASDNAAKNSANPSSAGDLLTLSLTLQEGQYIALATERGRLSVVLRNPNDQRTAEKIPDITSQQLMDKSAIVGIVHGGGRGRPTEVTGNQ